MRSYFVCLITLTFMLLVVSCKKDDNGSAGPAGTVLTPDVQKDKASVEKAGVDFVSQLNEMEKNKGIEALVQIGNLIGKDNFTDGIIKSSKPSGFNFFKLLNDIQMFSHRKITLTDLYKSMDYSSSKGGTQLEADYDKIKGIYDWNNLTEKWDKRTDLTDNLVINFPLSKDGTTNNVTFTITELAAQIITIDGNSQEVPVSFGWNLKVDGSIVISYSFTSSFVDNRPQSINSSLVVTPFSFNLSISCSSTKCTIIETLKNGNKVLLGFSASADGNWSEQNIESSKYHIPAEFDQWGNQIRSERDSVAVDKIFYDANVTFTLMDIKFSGLVDFKSLYPVINEINNTTYPTNQQERQAEADAINKYISIYLAHSSDNSVIATGEAYVSSRNESNWEWNPITQQYEQHTFVNYFMDFRFKFPDGSKADIETYTKEGFKSFVDELNNFMTNLSDKYGFDFTPIDYGKK